MRFFISLEIPETNREQLKAAQLRLKQIIPQVRLTDNEKLHLTIAFVGEEPEQIKDALVEVIKKGVWEVRPFEVTPAYIDGFPALHHPHTLWVGVKGDIDKLFIVRERIKDGIEGLGLPIDERRYVPHIAIAKVNDFDLQPPQEAELERMMSAPFDPIHITSIKLFESVPDRGFHKHNTLAEVTLC